MTNAQMKLTVQSPISIGSGSARLSSEPVARRDATIGDIKIVRTATAPGNLVSVFTIPAEVLAAAMAESIRNVPSKSASFVSSPPDKNTKPKASSL